MPPPNVTGSLHMGHAMFVTLEVGLLVTKSIDAYLLDRTVLCSFLVILLKHYFNVNMTSSHMCNCPPGYYDQI